MTLLVRVDFHGGKHYHSRKSCPAIAEYPQRRYTRVPLLIAQLRYKRCPLCIGGKK